MFGNVSSYVKSGAIALTMVLGVSSAYAMPAMPNSIAPAPVQSGIHNVNDAPLLLQNGRVGNQAWGNGNFNRWRGDGWRGNRNWNRGNWGHRNWNRGWRGDHRYYGDRRYYRDRYYGGYGGFGLGLGSGLLLGSVIPYAESPRYYAPRYRTGRVANSRVQWCYDRYRSYRASDNTYQPNYGPRRQCRAPF